MRSEFPRRAVHLDFHTMPGIHDFGSQFDAGEFARTLRQAHVEYVTVFAKCNLGFSYYPTKAGIVYPGLEFDLLGQMVEACHAEGVQVAAYFNAGLDHEQARRRREWCKVDRQGRVYNFEEMGHFFRNLCLNTGYRHHLLAMIREVLGRYPVDGLFLDCFSLTPCYGDECVQEMKRLGMDVFDEVQAAEYCERMTFGFLDEVRALVEQEAEGIFLYFNGMPLRRQPTHIELEVLPTGGWGYEFLPFVIRYARTLGKPYFTMTGRFHKSWGDFGGLRPFHSLLFDCYSSIANGGTCSVGDHLHPAGRLEPAVYGLIGEAYAQVQEYEQWTDGAVAEAEIAVIEPRLRNWPDHKLFLTAGEDALASVEGAARMLSELNCQFDVRDDGADLDRYRVVVLTDHVVVTDELKVALERHLKNGGGLLASSRAGLDPAGSRFALEGYAAEYIGPEPHDPSFFEALPPVDGDLPAMRTAIYQPGIEMAARNGAEVLARLHKPYVNVKTWDFEHEYLYTPPESDTGRPAAVRAGNIVHLSFPAFSAYHRDAVVAYRTLVGNCLRLLLEEPLVQAAGVPSFGRVTVTRKGTTRLVHVLTYVPELRGRAEVIEEPVTVRDVAIALRLDGSRVKGVSLAPGGAPLDYAVDGGYVRFTVPEVEGYALAVVEAE